jgi:hypothetical protein
MSADSSQSITKGGIIFNIPTGLANRQIGWEKQFGYDGHQAGYSKRILRINRLSRIMVQRA